MSKGSKRRKEDFKKIQTRWDEIDWTNGRRKKVQKMFGVEVKEVTCHRCHGIPDKENGVCSDCKDKGKVSIAVFQRQIGIRCDKCGLSDSLIYHSNEGVYGCHHTHRI